MANKKDEVLNKLIEEEGKLIRLLEAINEAISMSEEDSMRFKKYLESPITKGFLKSKGDEFKEIYEHRTVFVEKNEKIYLEEIQGKKSETEAKLAEVKKNIKREKKNKSARDRRAAKKAAEVKAEAIRKAVKKVSKKRSSKKTVDETTSCCSGTCKKCTEEPKTFCWGKKLKPKTETKKVEEKTLSPEDIKSINPNIDVCITFDTTGSMYPCLTQVRRSVKEVVTQLFKDIPDLRIAIIAHGDYQDARDKYVTKILDFTNDVNAVTHFVTNVGPTYGYDAPECYELVLHEARTKLSWISGRAKVITMIGDDVPHGRDYLHNTKRIDWRNELGLLLEANINVYGVHAMPGCRRHSKSFYKEIADKTGGFYLTLDQFATITDLIMGICYKQNSEKDFVEFAADLKKKGKLNRNLTRSLRTMAKEPSPDFAESYKEIFGEGPYEEEDEEDYIFYRDKPRKRSSGSYRYAYEKDGLSPVPGGRFQMIPVDKEDKIRDFIEKQGIDFKPGRGFYELIRYGKKKYLVQQYKEIILMDRDSGDIFNGSEPRKLLGLKPQIIGGRGSGIVENLSPKSLDKYRVFIQSTSYTRKLVPGSSLLYEVPDWKR